jgi:hypothetical protein
MGRWMMFRFLTEDFPVMKLANCSMERTLLTAFGTVNLGRRASSKNCPLNGALDDVSIFDRGLSGDEIGQLFDGEDIADGLVLSWVFA